MDRFLRMIDYVRKQKGRGLVLRGNVSPVLLTERGRQPLNKVMTCEEVDALLRALTPADLLPRLHECVPFQFACPTSGGTVRLRISFLEGRPEVLVLVEEEADSIGESDLPSPSVPVVLAAPGPPAVAVAGGLSPVIPAAPPMEIVPPSDAPSPVVSPPPLPPAIDFPPDYLSGLFAAALAASASDVALQTGTRPWGRIRGEVQPLDYGKALTPEQLQAVLFDLLPPDRRARWIEEGAVEFCLTYESRARVRCSLWSDHRGLCASCRILPVRPPSLAELQAPGFLSDLTRLERGLVILSGVRSSGVTTTLAAMVQAINAERRARVVTIESPVEYLHTPERALISQVEVPSQAPTVASALDRLAQADVDICAVGDLSSPESIGAALRLAEGGALVLGAMRLPDVPSTTERLVETAAASGSPGAADRVLRILRGVVCQRLCRPRRPGPLFPLFEALSGTPTALGLIRQGKYRDLHGTMFTTFDSGLANCVREDRITREEALRLATDPEVVRRHLA